mmetsp:Transcript_101724/g.294388  ORF Transcript_101724/g.294388 Transcript_101724/m.294388 type:complete len:249 (-) Transcript_101724:67-813(-)
MMNKEKRRKHIFPSGSPSTKNSPVTPKLLGSPCPGSCCPCRRGPESMPALPTSITLLAPCGPCTTNALEEDAAESLLPPMWQSTLCIGTSGANSLLVGTGECTAEVAPLLFEAVGVERVLPKVRGLPLEGARSTNDFCTSVTLSATPANCASWAAKRSSKCILNWISIVSIALSTMRPSTKGSSPSMPCIPDIAAWSAWAIGITGANPQGVCTIPGGAAKRPEVGGKAAPRRSAEYQPCRKESLRNTF